MKKTFAKYLYWIMLVAVFMPYGRIFGVDHEPIDAPIGLALGLIFAFAFGTPCPKANKFVSKYMLQGSVVGLGFGMNLIKSLQSGSEGMIFTVVSVIGVMVLGVLLAAYMKVERKTGYLISSGTAICGGSAIAAVGPVIKADSNQMAVAMGVVFILNAVALFIFPPMGHFFGMSQAQFGTWAAIAIHDTSSVVGAGAAYGPEACELATLIKCTRALWIIPLALFTMWFYRDKSKGVNADGTSAKKGKISVPWFIFLFVLAMIINTYTPASATWLVGEHGLYHVIVLLAKRALVAILFAIGAGLSFKVIRSVGVRPLILAITLWAAIGASSLFVVLHTIR